MSLSDLLWSCSLLWPFRVLCGLFVVLYDLFMAFHGFVSSFLAVIDPNSFGLVKEYLHISFFLRSNIALTFQPSVDLSKPRMILSRYSAMLCMNVWPLVRSPMPANCNAWPANQMAALRWTRSLIGHRVESLCLVLGMHPNRMLSRGFNPIMPLSLWNLTRPLIIALTTLW